MTTAHYSNTRSDEWIKEKMVRHRGARGDEERDLIRQKLDNGYENRGETHTIYYLQGSPIKAYAVRVSKRISFYEMRGKRWAMYRISGKPPIKHEISKKNTDLLGEQV